MLTETPALLLTSEIFYPGWRATVNGRTARIHEVDGALRGVVVPKGESDVIFHYAPRPVRRSPGSHFSGWIMAFLDRKRSRS